MSDRAYWWPSFWAAGIILAAGTPLFWALRGAVPGRKAPSEPGAPSQLRRDTAAALAVLGLVLVAAGACVAAMRSIPWSVPLFVAGFGVEAWVGRSFRTFRHDSPSLRRIVRFADGATTASLFAGVLVVGNVLAFRYGERPFDLTRERAYSLESLSINQLKTLGRPVTFTAFFGNSERSVQQLDRVRQLLDLYRAENPAKVRVDVVSLYGDPQRTQELIRTFPDVATSPGGGVAISYGDGASADKLVVRNPELFDPDRAEFRGEDALTSALIRLREGKKSRVGMTTGHGETPTSATANRQSVARLKARLEGQGAAVVEVDLTRGPIPNDISVALLVGPKSPFSAQDLGRLTAFLDRGGKLLILLDGRAKTGLEGWLASSNISVGAGIVVDPRAPYVGNPTLVPTTVSARAFHPVTSPLVNREILLPAAVPLTIAAPPTNPGVRAETILSTPAGTFAESDQNTLARPAFDPAKDRPGPIVVAVAASDLPKTRTDEPARRLVIISSPSLADDYFASRFEANLDLVTNALQWLRGRADLQGIAPRRREVIRFSADPALQARLVVLPTVLSLGLIVALGVTTYLARRS